MSHIRTLSATVVGLSLGSLILAGCVTTPKGPEYEAARIIERIGDKEETPGWAIGDVAMSEDNGSVFFIHQMSMGGDARTEACLKAADLDGRSAMVRYIKDNITASGQVNETDAVSDPGYESLTAFLGQGKLSGVQVKDRYWEKREESASSGERVLRVRCVVRLGIKKNVLEKQLRDAMTAQGGNPKIREQLLEAQKSFIEGISESNAH